MAEAHDRAAPGGVSSPVAEKAVSTSTSAITTLTGEHLYTINGYSLVKGIGDGEPIASERFTVGG